jgi:hypothetical protein
MSSPNPIEPFLLELDALWEETTTKLAIRVIGSTALMLQANYLRGTKDSDILGIEPVQGKIREKLQNLAGLGSPLHDSKLKRFNGSDRDDIRAMVDMDLVEHERLIERFSSAVDRFGMDARADDLPSIVKNLHWVERECFSTRPTRIELPSWVEPE